jgi:hypothetical protein
MNPSCYQVGNASVSHIGKEAKDGFAYGYENSILMVYYTVCTACGGPKGLGLPAQLKLEPDFIPAQEEPVEGELVLA